MIGETIKVGDDIEITIAKQTRNSVTLGIEAPQDVTIHRQELYLAIQKDKR
jgi:carbon storage regulator